ncbi:MAG: YHS domain-containing protein [Anaerolinea sp.]|jgi:signal transduction histidine kinase/YHS domain-containing protein|nr:YHS domain-containing protein [Anaerolinea sp.]
MAKKAQRLRKAQEAGAAFRHALTEGQEAERTRIARELHDDTVQTLIAVAQCIDLATRWIESDPKPAIDLLTTARTQAVESVGSLRRLIANLRPPMLEELGLIPALKMLGQGEKDTHVEVNVLGSERRLNEAVELALFRVAQEAVQNAKRHGQAQHITLQVHFSPHELTLTISDDGNGFQLPDQFDSLAMTGHYGLLGMIERVQQLGGSIQIISKPEHGTQIRVVLPVANAEQPTTTVLDPVCGALIQPERAYGSIVYHGQRYFFCCPICQGAFQQDPPLYLSPQRPIESQ